MEKQNCCSSDQSFRSAAAVLTKHARRIISGSYDDVDQIFNLTNRETHPPEVVELAEAFGMMSVKVEAREFSLEQTIEELCRKKAELESAMSAREEFGRLFILFALFMGIYNFLIAWVNRATFMQAHSKLAIPLEGMVFCVILTSLAIVMIKGSGLPLSSFGVTWKGTGKSIRESLVYTAAFIAALIAFKAWAIQSIPAMSGRSLFNLKAIDTIFWVYLLVAPFQEFVARGVLQSSISRLLYGRHATLWAIVTTSVLFGVTHTFYSLPLALTTTAASLFWGWLYSRQGTLVGTSISHFLMGNALVLLDFWPYLAS